MDNKHKILLAVGITAIVTDMIPTPADYFVFKSEQRNRKRLEAGEITPRQYWQNQAAYYYLYNPLWWAAVLGVTLLSGKELDTRVYTGIGIISAGAVIGILSRNVREDSNK